MVVVDIVAVWINSAMTGAMMSSVCDVEIGGMAKNEEYQ
jgi:hypothetical protein